MSFQEKHTPLLEVAIMGEDSREITLKEEILSPIFAIIRLLLLCSAHIFFGINKFIWVSCHSICSQFFPLT